MLAGIFYHSRVVNLQADAEADSQLQNRTFYVCRICLIHFAICVLSGALVTILHHALLFPRGFVIKFGCGLPPTELPSKIPKNKSVSRFISTPIACENTIDVLFN